jgi:predicted dinucleotide-binding enzyme
MTYRQQSSKPRSGRNPIVGDDDTANAEFAELADTLGFAPIYVGTPGDDGALIELD